MRYVLGRLGQMVVILGILSVALFGLMSAMPGNPVDMLITSNPRVKPEDVIRLKKLRGLDKPWYVQYVRWFWGYDEAALPVKIAGLPELEAKQGVLARVDLAPYIRLPQDMSLTSVKLVPLLGSIANGFEISQRFDSAGIHRLWFVVHQSNSLDTLGHVMVKVSPLEKQEIKSAAGGVYVKDIPVQVVDDPTQFKVDLAKYVDAPVGPLLKFHLRDGAPGRLSQDGTYRHVFAAPGQTVVAFEATAGPHTVVSAFMVDHGPIPDRNHFSRGFIFALAGYTDSLGFSNAYKRPVWELLAGAPPSVSESSSQTVSFFSRPGRIANTIFLMLPALFLSLLIALPLGVLSAYRQYSWLDYVVNFFAFIGISLPVFWFGIMILYVFAERMQWFPAGGMQTPDSDYLNLWSLIADRAKYAVLPTFVLSIAYVGRWLRYMRASMLEVLPQDYIRTARAKGLSENKVILKHALRNALIPVVTILAISIPALFGGAVLTETVFSWPGIGRLQYDAVISSDYYVAVVVFLIEAALVMLGNLLADLLYVVVDPRIRQNA
jgi:peptide/nickel transport system permease protein